MTLFSKHEARLEAAIEACADRGYWSPFQESPSRKHHPEGAKAAGLLAFEDLLQRPFELDQPAVGRVGQEVSPFTGEALGIDYPKVDPEQVMSAAREAMKSWAAASPKARTGICLEMLDRLASHSFRNAFATMHTTGQAFMMAFAGSGANSLDRGLEAVATAWKAMSDVPESSTFSRRFGPGPAVILEKSYRLVPRGVSVVFSCGSYPAWNAYPAIFATLATGNAVVVKPHPGCILPMALAVRECRAVLVEQGFSPDLVTLAADTRDAPVGMALVDHPATAFVDFTGGQRFGAFLESHCRRARAYTETAGCNSVVLESVEDLDAVLRAIAHSICIFSSQMCTAAQNVFVPKEGVRTPSGRVSAASVRQRLVDAVDALVADPAHAAALCGAIQSPETLKEMAELAAEAEVLRPTTPYAHPQFPKARTATPLILQAKAGDSVYRREYFGPMAFVIEADNARAALDHATRDASECGAISSYLYTTDPTFLALAEGAYLEAGASVGINLIRQLPINYAAAYSDYHVTGLNPAGTASLTDLAFVADRFRIVQIKKECASSQPSATIS